MCWNGTANGIDPEVIGELGIARGDVAGHAFAEPEGAEETETGGQALFDVRALVLDVVERRASSTEWACPR